MLPVLGNGLRDCISLRSLNALHASWRALSRSVVLAGLAFARQRHTQHSAWLHAGLDFDLRFAEFPRVQCRGDFYAAENPVFAR